MVRDLVAEYIINKKKYCKQTDLDKCIAKKEMQRRQEARRNQKAYTGKGITAKQLSKRQQEQNHNIALAQSRNAMLRMLRRNPPVIEEEIEQTNPVETLPISYYSHLLPQDIQMGYNFTQPKYQELMEYQSGGPLNYLNFFK